MPSRCLKIIEPTVDVMYKQFPKFTAEASGLSDLFVVAAFIVLLGAVVLAVMYLKKK